MTLTRTRVAAVLALTLMLMSLTATAVQSADGARKARVLVILHALERGDHVHITGGSEAPEEGGRSLGDPLYGRTRTRLLYQRVPALNQTFIRTVAGFDRDPDLSTALTRVFGERAPIIEIATTTDGARYLRRATLDTLTDAAREDGFDFVIALFDDFVGLRTRDWADADQGLLTPGYSVGYALHDVASNRILKRGRAHADGFMRAPHDVAVANRELFVATWPYLCVVNATQIADELLRSDQLHVMAERVGRGGEMPPVAAKLAEFERRMQWKLKPAKGWRERSVNGFSRVLEPRGNRSRDVQMRFSIDLMIPELQQGATSVEEYSRIYDRNRRLQLPLSGPLTRFAEVSAPGYDVFRFTGQGGDHNLVFLRATPDAVVRVVTFSIVGDFDAQYPGLRPQIESMLAGSTVTLRN